MIDKTCIIETNKIGKDVQIMPYSVIRNNVVIGDRVVIHPHVVIESGVIIGNDVEIFPGAYIGKIPKGAGAITRKPSFEKQIFIGNGCSIGPNSTIYYDVKIGENSLIGDCASIREQSVIGKNCIISRCVTLNYNSHVGDRTKIMDLTHITGNTFIGNDVFISTGVSTTNDNSLGSIEYDEQKTIGPKIRDFAKIAAGVCILPNVEIGQNSIVGANSLVTKDVLSNRLVKGIPAREDRNIEI